MKKVFSRLVSSALAAVMLTSGLVITTPVSVLAAPAFTSTGGWNETIYAQLSGVSDADVTGVSYSGTVSGSLTGEDLQYLVRDNNGGVRIDIPGLTAGTYSLTVTTASGSVTQSNIVVPEQDRSGYAHYNYTDGVGAYNDDGTLKANAKVLYVTDENKDTVTITSKDGTTVKGIGHILNSAGKDNGTGVNSKGGLPNNNAGIIAKLAEDGTPLVVRIIGNVTSPDGVTAFDSVDYGGSLNDNGFMVRMQGGKDITVEGIGTDATINGWGIHFICDTAGGAKGYGKSFETRNITFRNVPEDCLGMEGQYESSKLTPVERCWVHNCSFYAPSIANPAESDKAGGDGACDFKRGMYFTNSYCYYEGYHKTNLVGSGDSDAAGPQYHLTYHHNYWKNCESRGPLARKANIHMYNNVFEGQTSYCMNPRVNAYIFSEYNLFYQCKNPITLDSGGVVKSYNDSFSGCIEANEGTIVDSKSTTVSSSCAYANFDTNSSVSYIPSGDYELQEDVTAAKAVVLAEAGVMAEDPVSAEEVNTSILSSDRQPTASVQLPYKHDLNSSYVTAKSCILDNVIFNVNKIDASMVSTTTDEIGQNIVFNVNTAVNITITDGGATYPVVLINDSGVEYLTGSGTAYNVPAGTYIIQSSGFQAAKSGSPAKFKEAKISYLAIEAYDPTAPTVTEPTTQATTQAVETTTNKQVSETTTSSDQSTETTTQGSTPITGGQSHNFTANDTSSSFYTFAGSTTTNKGSVEYGSLELTKCLKMDSSGKVTFTNSSAGKLTLVFNSTNDNNIIKIDSTEYTIPQSGIVTADVDAGTHTVAKSTGESHLFYINYADNTSGEETTQATTEATTEETTKATTEATTETTTGEPDPVDGVKVIVGDNTGVVGDELTVPVKITGTTVGCYTAEITYDKDMLTFVRAEAGNSDDGIVFDYNEDNDAIIVSATNANGVDTSLLFNLVFTAKAAGTAAVNVTFTELLNTEDAEITPDVTNGSVGITDSTVTPTKLGDVDKDGDVDSIDAALLLRHISGIDVITDTVSLANADCDGISGIDMRDVIWILNNKTSAEETGSTTEAATETTTAAVESGLTALEAADYSVDTMISDTSRFTLHNTQSDGQVRLADTDSYLEFVVNDGANVTITYECASTNTNKTAAVCINGQTSPYLAGKAAAQDFTVTGLSAGTYRITALETGGTTARITALSISYGEYVTKATTETTTETTTVATTVTTEATTASTTETTETTTTAAVEGGLVAGTYTLNKVNVVTNGITGMDASKIYSSDSGAIKVRAGQYLTVTPAVSGTLTITYNGKALVIEDSDGNALATSSASPFSYNVTAGVTYRIDGSDAGNNTNLTELTLGNGSVVPETTTETTTKSTDATTTTSKQESSSETTTKYQGGSSGSVTLTPVPSNVVATISSNSADDFKAALSTLNSKGGTVLIDTKEITIPASYKSTSLKLSGSKTAALVGVQQSDGTYPVINFAAARDAGSTKRGITVSGSNQIIQNLIIESAGDNGILVDGGTDNVIEHVIARYNGDTGIQLSNDATGNVIRYCYSYRNCDVGTYGANADGFAPKLGAKDTTFEYCYSWDNADDGWDSYDKTGDNTPSVVYNHCACWNNGNPETFTGAYDLANGDALDKKMWTIQQLMSSDSSFESKYNSGSISTSGKINSVAFSSWVSKAESSMNGNGFKFGSSETATDGSVTRSAFYCVSFDHKSKGFDNNNSKNCKGYFNNCASFDNQRNYSLPYDLVQWDNVYGWDYTTSNTANSTPKEPEIPSNSAAVEAEIRGIAKQIIDSVNADKIPDDVTFDNISIFS